MQVATSSWIAETLPQCEQVTERSVGTCLGRRKHFDERLKLWQDPMHLGLLQHDLTDEHLPAITCASPRKITEPLRTPFENGVDDRF